MHSSLRRYHCALQRQLVDARHDVDALLDTLHDDVLPQIKLELALADPDTLWLAEWLSDAASVFRLLRRHKFLRPFTLQDIHAIALWRLRILRPVLCIQIPPLLHCLPPPIADPFGRPIIVLRLASLQTLTCPIKDLLLQEVERLRLHLRYIRDHDAHTGSVPLQYLVLVDLDGISIQNYNLDLCSWVLTEVIPRYPGMLASVFLLNYSWIHSGAWSLVKRILPSSVISRVYFPSKAQLLAYCSAASLPADYGGLLPPLDHIDDALRSSYQTCHLPLPAPPPDLPDADAPQSSPTLQRAPSTITLPPLSSRNPFFGYPATASASSPHTIRHVQRGKRELLRTLAVLWWRHWGRWVRAGTWAITCTLILVWVLRTRVRLRVRRTGVEIGSTAEALVALVGLPRSRAAA